MKNSAILKTGILFLIWISLGCSDENHEYIEIESLEKIYQIAILDAVVAEENEIYHDLIDINETNEYLIWLEGSGEKRVLVVTWTNYPDSYPEGETVTTWWGETWVTVVPEITDWFQYNDVDRSDIVLRTEQLLGLPKDSGYTHFVELWVRPEDMFRPSPDREITDNSAQLSFPDGTEEWYIEWFNDNIIYSYFPARYPWTRLGYTYDWGSLYTEIGLSEFVIIENADVIVASVVSTEAYLVERY